ncbi:MAG: hypothetical protein HKN49_09830 [Gammaproteobacteria bacterium]|nr:hypothetical protein [Gammaproteobacteria bacterium]
MTIEPENLNRHIPVLIVAIVLATSLGYSGQRQEQDTSVLLHDTANQVVPEGTVPAVVVEIDGEPVTGRVSHALPAGMHVIRVRPACPSPSGTCLYAGEFNDEHEIPVAIDFEAGVQYWMAARLLRVRTGQVAADRWDAQPWHTAVVPVPLAANSTPKMAHQARQTVSPPTILERYKVGSVGNYNGKEKIQSEKKVF